MGSGINITQILLTNSMGILLVILMLVGSKWKITGEAIERKIVIVMLVLTMFSCLADPIVFYADGKEGFIPYFAVYFGNLLLYVSNIILGPIWMVLVCHHISGRVHIVQKVVIVIVETLCVSLLIANFFVPIVFSVDAHSVYHRGEYFWVYSFVEIAFIVDGVFVYLRKKIKGGLLRFFPVWQFVLPAAFGVLVQTIFYGVSFIWPCIAISMNCMVNSLQNETLYQDKLTGSYNRYYLDVISEEYRHLRNAKVIAMMLDMNDFKSINDYFGHAMGDDALKCIATIFNKAVGPLGSVIRYAGDEFVILLNTDKTETAQTVINKIHTLSKEFNENEGKPYTLSVSVGYSVVDYSTQSSDEILSIIDKKMYEDKNLYYQTSGVVRKHG